jgi:hypothetical protein
MLRQCLKELAMEDRDVVRLLAVARAAVGVIWLLAPDKVIKAWTGEDVASVSARVVGRGFGGRDLALAVGTLITLEDERALATWLKAGALSDAADAVGTLAAFKELGSVRRLFWAAAAAGTTALGVRLAGTVGLRRTAGGEVARVLR